MRDLIIKTLQLARLRSPDTKLDMENLNLKQEVDNIIDETTFNNIKLLDGDYRNFSYQTGEDTTNVFSVSIYRQGTTATGFTAAGLEVDTANVSTLVFTASGSSTALSNVDTAIEYVSDALQQVGAWISRLTVKESTLSIAITNTEATKSRILDADIAREQLNSTKLQILQQTSTAQLAQANVMPQNVLALFR